MSVGGTHKSTFITKDDGRQRSEPLPEIPSSSSVSISLLPRPNATPSQSPETVTVNGYPGVNL